MGAVAVALHEFEEFFFGDAGQDRRVGDLVAVQVQDGQDDAVAVGVEEFVGVPAGGQWAGFGLAVSDDAGDDQAGVVEGGAVGVGEGVAEFAAFVDGAGGLGGDVAGDAAGEGELAEEFPHAFGVLGDVGVFLGVGAFEPGVGDCGGAAVAGAGDVDHVLVAFGDDPVEVGEAEVQSGGGAPVSEQAGFEVLGCEGFGEQGVVQQVDLSDGQVVGGSPVGVDALQFVHGDYGSRFSLDHLGAEVLW